MGTTKKKTNKIKLFSARGGFDLPFFTLVMSLLVIGLIMLFSASYANAHYYYGGDSLHFIKRQAFFAVVGVVLMIITSYFDYHWLRKLVYPMLIVTYILLIVVLFMPKIHNVHRWIPLGPLTFQPSEIAKFTIVVVFAHLISINYKRMKLFTVGVLPFMVILGSFAILLVLEPHLSGTVLILLIGLIVMFVGGTSLKWFAMGGGVMAAGLAYVVLFTDIIQYAMTRLQVWFDPFKDPAGKGYQTIQSLYAIGSGGLLGLGLGNSRQKYLYIPEPQNDFIFAVVCEELGFVGATIIIILFALLVWRGFIIAMRAPDKFGSLIAVGLIVQVGLQAALNIAVVTNTIPNTGISLPFFSAGGTALIMLLVQMGMILSISRSANIVKK